MKKQLIQNYFTTVNKSNKLNVILFQLYYFKRDNRKWLTNIENMTKIYIIYLKQVIIWVFGVWIFVVLII